MNAKQMNTFIKHFDLHFKQTDCTVLHSTSGKKPHIDVLIYEPNDEYPFWKLVTMGAGDYKMPTIPNTLGNRNEYILFVDPSEDLKDKEKVAWYANKLFSIALYPMVTESHITYGHSIEWGEEEESDMVGAYLEMPQVIPDVSVLRCKLGMFKTVVCLQAVLLTRGEIDKLLEIGSENFSEYLYPEEGKSHYLSERYRSEKF